MRRVTPYSKAGIAKIDGRSREARFLKRVRAELAAHVGGTPSATQRALIDRAALLSLHMMQLDARALESGGMTAHDQRTYLAWSNTLARTMRQLGLQDAAKRTPTLAEYVGASA